MRELARIERVPGTRADVQEVDRETTAPNAESVGFGSTRRVILWNTLLDGRFSRGEVRVVVAHELGHIAHDHILKRVGWLALFLLPAAGLVAFFTRPRGGLARPEAVPVALFVFVVLQLLTDAADEHRLAPRRGRGRLVGAARHARPRRRALAVSRTSPRPASPTPTRRRGATCCSTTTRRSCSASPWSTPGRRVAREAGAAMSRVRRTRRPRGHASLWRVYHLELRKFPHTVCRYNQSEAQVRAVLVPWVNEEWFEEGEQKWNSNEATLTVLEGPELSMPELAMGRGWRNAQRRSEDVTERVLAAVREQAPPGGTPADAAASPAGTGVEGGRAKAPPRRRRTRARPPIRSCSRDSLALELLALLDGGPVALSSPSVR